MRAPLGTLHKMIVESSDPDAKYSPFGENATLYIEDEWPVRVLMQTPFDTSQIPIVLDPDAKYTPFGENTTL